MSSSGRVWIIVLYVKNPVTVGIVRWVTSVFIGEGFLKIVTADRTVRILSESLTTTRIPCYYWDTRAHGSTKYDDLLTLNFRLADIPDSLVLVEWVLLVTATSGGFESGRVSAFSTIRLLSGSAR